MSKRKVRRAITVKGKHGTYTAHRLVAADANHAETTEHRALKQQSSLLGRYLRTAGRVVTLGSRAVVAAIHKRHSGLQAMNPWEAHHTEGVDTRNSQLGGVQKFYGTSGPGSDHSLFAHLVGTMRDESKPRFDVPNENARLLRAHARNRQAAGVSAGMAAQTERYARPGSPNAGDFDFYRHDPWRTAAHMGGISGSLMRRYGRDNVAQVPQNPNKWVR